MILKKVERGNFEDVKSINVMNILKLVLLTVSVLYSNLVFSQAQKVNRVLIIGLDGARPDAIQLANTPTIDALVANGTYSWDALNEGTTSSGPGWSNILTGVWQDKHGVVDNSFNGSDFTSYPPLFKRIEEHDPDLYTISICEWRPINDFIITQTADEVINTSGPADTEAKVISALTSKDPDVMFVHLDSPDHAGHSYGFSQDIPQYISTLEAVDTSIGKMLEALESRATREEENWLIIITTDHGGLGNSHGGSSLDERNVFFIASGDNVEKKKIEKIVGEEVLIPPVANCMADTVELYFDGADDVVQMPLSPLLDFGTDQDFSVEVRMRTDIAADVSIVGNKDWVTGQNKGFVFSFSGGTWKVNVGDGRSGTRVDVNGNNVSDNEWHMLSATFDRDGNLNIYENGTLVGTKSVAGIDDITTGLPFSIGADGLKAYEFHGYIAEVRVFDALLSPDDIANWSCEKLNDGHNKYENLIGYWRLNEGANSSTAADLSKSDLKGNIEGATWKNATVGETVVEYDYSETPRQVDVVPTALEYLCIPIDAGWELDGKIQGVECVPPIVTGLEVLEEKSFSVYPNPIREGQSLNLTYGGDAIGRRVHAILYDNLGNRILRQKLILEKQMTVEIRNGLHISAGIYTLVLESPAMSYGKSRIIIQE